MGRMPVRCMFCDVLIETKECEDAQDGKISSGICEECMRAHYPDEADEVLEVMLPAKPQTKPA